MFYDLILLVAFCIWVFWFIHTRKHNLKKEGWMYLYKTQLGVKYIDKFSKKYSKFLHFMKYPIVVMGYILMVGILFLLVQTVYMYVRYPQISQIIKAPPVMPLIPYFTQIFGVESFFPAFYFMYFIIALAVVAIVHEFSHGIYMRLFGTKIKSTGFAFLGPILGAFVEQDEKSFLKEKNFEQRVVLAAGVFANMLFSLIFFFLLVLFFYASYAPAGYIFDNYAYETVAVNEIKSYKYLQENLTGISTGNKTYIYPMNLSNFLTSMDEKNPEYILLYLDAPAIRENLRGIITQIDDQKIRDAEQLREYLQNKNPGDNITIKTLYNDSELNFEIQLAENPDNQTKAFIGIKNNIPSSRGIFSKIVGLFTNFRTDSTYYQAKYNPIVADYIYDLIWWVMMINLFVALFNMLPLGILDGGRFFYLTVLSITKKEKFSQKSFKLMTQLIGLIFLAMMIAWFFSLF